MTAGLHTANFANKLLDTLSNTSFAAGATTYIQLHTADPGAAGTTGVSGVALRKALTWSAAASGSKAIMATLPQWATWAGGSETITHVSVWDALTTGNFLYSGALTASKAVSNGDTFNIASHSIALTPLAA